MRIDILITTSGFLGLLIAILSLFFDVKPAKRNISKRDLGFIILWSALTILGIVNLYYVRSDNNVNDSQESNDTQNTNTLETSSSTEEESGAPESSTDNVETTDLSEDELLIRQNFDLIKQLKAEYTDEDMKTIESDALCLYFYESAGYLYRNLKSNEISYELSGIAVTPIKVIVLDYFSDEIIYTFTPKQKGSIEYSPGDKNMFYCVVFHDDYEICVTPPISVVGGERRYYTYCYLKKINSEYTSLFQICAYMSDFKLDNVYSTVTDDYIVKIELSDKDSGINSTIYQMQISESGLLSLNRNTYFGLNTDYRMDISLYRKTDDEDEFVAQTTFDGTITNTNLVDIYFTINNEK